VRCRSARWKSCNIELKGHALRVRGLGMADLRLCSLEHYLNAL
jgi:hypothetical protein